MGTATNYSLFSPPFNLITEAVPGQISCDSSVSIFHIRKYLVPATRPMIINCFPQLVLPTNQVQVLKNLTQVITKICVFIYHNRHKAYCPGRCGMVCSTRSTTQAHPDRHSEPGRCSQRWASELETDWILQLQTPPGDRGQEINTNT